LTFLSAWSIFIDALRQFTIVQEVRMTDKETTTAGEMPTPEEAQRSLTDSLRRVMLASIGAVALTKDELDSFIKKLVALGEVAEEEGKKLMTELTEKRKRKTGEAEEMASTRVHEMMEKMDIPTRQDIKALSDKINALTKKVDDLKKSQ
jgi:poly(hydroxyalkanoate) granule-associated protein